MAVTSMSTAVAASKNGNWNIGGFDITGSNTVKATYGKGTTSGSAKPYKNRVVVSIYNKKNKRMAIGSSMVMKAQASKTLLGVNPKRVYSCHGVYDRNNNIVDGVLKSLNTSR